VVAFQRDLHPADTFTLADLALTVLTGAGAAVPVFTPVTHVRGGSGSSGVTGSSGQARMRGGSGESGTIGGDGRTDAHA
jgi:hypothetical protein